MALISLKDALSDFYRAQDYWLIPLFRFMTCFLVLFLSVSAFTETKLGGSVLLLLFLSLLASFLPWSVIPLEAAVFLLYCYYQTSLELSVSAAIFFVLLMLVQTSFRGGHAVLIALTALGFLWHVPFVVPIIAGLSLGLVAAVPIALGTLSYYFLSLLSGNFDLQSVGTDVEEMANLYGELFLHYIENREMVLMLLALILCFSVVFILRSLDFDYAWYTAAVLGPGFGVLTLFIGNYILGESVVSIFGAALSAVGSGVIGLVYAFFVHDADYRRTEKLQFEDDSYYYHVKAVPKRRER